MLLVVQMYFERKCSRVSKSFLKFTFAGKIAIFTISPFLQKPFVKVSSCESMISILRKDAEINFEDFVSYLNRQERAHLSKQHLVYDLSFVIGY